MSRSLQLSQIARMIRAASLCEAESLPTRDGLERFRALETRRLTRRELLAGAATVAGGLTLGRIASASGGPSPRIAIVGGGLAGLVCADRLRAKGIRAQIFEAGARVGGRCHSLRNYFPGQTAELGGEFIDTGHKTMLAYANEFNLLKEDVTRLPGGATFHFDGSHHSEEDVVDEYRELAPRLRQDLQTLSGEPTFETHSPADVELDELDLETYLGSRAYDLPLVRQVLDVAYVAEYGLETREQSSLNLLLFLHADRRSKFTPFGVFSDERYHLVDGNDGIAQGIASRLLEPVRMGMRLARLGRNGFGEYVLRFSNGETYRADAVVLAIPFTVLRGVTLEPSLGLSANKLRAIDELGYGMNAKTMVGFSGKPWLDLHAKNGETYTDLSNAQNTWETSPTTSAGRSVLTDYAGGDRGRTLASKSLGFRVGQFLESMEVIYPGISASHNGLAMRKHWPSDPLSLGSYTCYKPGQFTSLAGLEAQPAGLLKFAGEHADSFYSWQGFMEGACLSGVRAANEILADIKSGAL